LLSSALGDARSRYMLGLIHDPSFGMRSNPAKAMKWYQRAAEQGYALTQYKLGMMHRNRFDVATRACFDALSLENKAQSLPSELV
jgi:TPR repeat protein